MLNLFPHRFRAFLNILDPRMRNGCERHDRVSAVTLRRTLWRRRGRSGRAESAESGSRRCRRCRSTIFCTPRSTPRALRSLWLGVVLGGLVCSALSQLSPSFVATFKTSLQATATARSNRTGHQHIQKNLEESIRHHTTSYDIIRHH